MKWFEYILIVVFFLMFITPIYFKIKIIKNIKPSCTTGCGNCNKDCPLKKYHSHSSSKYLYKQD